MSKIVQPLPMARSISANPQAPVLSIQQAAEVLNVSTKTLRRWEKQGLLVALRTPGNQRRYSLQQLEDFQANPTPAISPVTYTPAPEPETVNSTPELVPDFPSSPASSSGNRLMFKSALLALAFLVLVALPAYASFSSGLAQKSLQIIRTRLSPLISALPQPNSTTQVKSNLTLNAQQLSNGSSSVLAGETSLDDFLFSVNVPASFSSTATISGNLTAPNIVYNLNAGTGITITGDPQTPTISAADLTTSLDYFSNFTVGSTTIAASGNDDTFTIAAGSNVSISTDTTNKKITISSTDTDTVGLSGTVGVANGGTGITTYTTGDLLYASATDTLSKLPVGTNGQILTVSGGIPSWGGTTSGCTTNCLVTDPGSTQIITPTATDATGLSIAQAASGTADIFSVTNNGSSTKYLFVNSAGTISLNSSVTLGGNLTGSGSPTLSGLGAITAGTYNTANISGGTLSGGTVSGGTLSGGTYSASGSTVAGAFTSTIGDGTSFSVSDGTNTLFTVSDTGGTYGDLINIASITLRGSTDINTSSNENLTLTANGTGDIVVTTDSDTTFAVSNLANCDTIDTDANGVLTCGVDSGGSVNLQGAYDNDVNGSDSIIALTANDDSLIFRNPAAAGTDSSYTVFIDQLNTGAVNTLDLANAGTGTGVSLSLSNTSGTRTNGILIDQTGAGTTSNALNITESAGTISTGINIGAGLGTGINLNDNTLVNIGNVGTDFDSSGGLTLAGTLTANSTFAANGTVNLGDGGDTVTLAGSTLVANLTDNVSDSLDIQQGSNNYFNINTTDASENLSFGNSTTNPTFTFLGSGDVTLNNASSELRILESTGDTFYGALDVGDLSANRTYTFPDSSGEVCLSSGNCAGGGGGVTTSGGTTNTLAKFTGAQAIGDASITDDGSTVGFTTNLTSALSASENIAITSDLATAGTLNVLSLTTTPSSSNGTITGILLQQADSANANPLDVAFKVDNADTNLAIPTALQITNSGGGGFTTLLDTPSLDITGTGAISGATGLVSSGTITFSDLSTGVIINSSGTLSSEAQLAVARGGTGASTFTSNGVLYGNSGSAVQVTSAGTGGQVLLANASGVPTFTTLGTDVSVNSSGAVTIATDAVALTTDTTGEYVATITAGNGISGSSSTEGGTPTIALSDLTGNWSQSGAFDIVLNNAASELQILESSGATFYGTLDVADLSDNRTYTLPDSTGSVCIVEAGNCFGAGSGGVTTSGGNNNRLAKFTGTYTIGDSSFTDDGTSVTLSSSATTQTLLALTGTSLTSGKLTNFTSSNNSAANTAWSANAFNVTNSQGTTAVSSGSIAGVDLQFTQNTSISGNTETALRINVAQNDSSSTDAAVASLLDLANNDTATGNQISVTDGIRITGSNITNGINLSGTFGTNLITSTNFIVTQAGGVSFEGSLADISDGTVTINDDLQVSGNDITDSANTTRITLGDTTSLTNTTFTLSGTTILNGTSLTSINGGATAIDFTEFDVSASTGSVTINDSGDAGSVSVEGTVLDINDLTFVGAGTLSSGSATTLTINSGTTGTLSIGDDASAETINIGTGAAAKTLTLGSTTTSSTLTLQAGTGGINLNLIDNTPTQFKIAQSTNDYLTINTTDASENIVFGNTSTNPSYVFTGTGDLTLNHASAELRILESAGDTYFATLDAPNLSSDQTYTFPTTGGELCTVSAGNCAGSGTGVTTAGGTTNTLPKFTGSQSIGDSNLSDDGTTVTIAAGKNFALADGVGTFTQTFSPLGTTAAANGFTLTPKFTLDATDQVLSALYINANTNSNDDSGDVLYGINLDNITDSTADETAIRIGEDWGNLLEFEGATNDSIETFLRVADPTSTDKVITFPNDTGTVCLSSGNCAGGAGGSKWTDSGSLTYLTNTTDDLAVGGSSSTALFYLDSANGGKLSVNSTATSGNLLSLAFGSATSQAGDITGALIDLSTNLTGATDQDLTGVRVNTPALTQSAANTTTYTGFNLGTAGALVQNTAAGTLAFRGANVTTPNLTQTTGTVSADGFRSANGTVTTAGTQNLFHGAATGVGAGSLNGLLLDGITGGSGTEYALSVGSGWDSVLRVNGTEVINGSGQVAAAQITGTLLSTSADSGSSTLDRGDTLAINGGTNGIDTSLSGDTYTLNLDTTEIGTTTFGSGSAVTWTFDASGGTDTTIAFGNNTQTLTTGTLTLSGTTTLTASSLTTLTGGATAIDFTEFDVSATTGSITINDDGDAGSLSVDGTNLDINDLTFVGAGTLSTGTASALTINSGTTGTLAIGDDASAETINLGTGAAAKAITLGSTNTTSSLALQAGTGNLTITAASTGDVVFTGDADTDLQLNGVQSGSGNALCLDTGNNNRLVTCTVGSGGVSGSGTAGQIAFFDGTNSITSETTGFGWDATNNLLTVDTAATTQTGSSFSGTSFTTGELLDLTATFAPTDGSTNEGIDLNITHSPTTNPDNFQSFNLTTTDGTALANTLYNQSNTLTLTGNAAKVGLGVYSTVSSSSTTGDTLSALDAATTVTGILGSATTRNVYGLRSQPTAGAESTAGTTNLYGGYFNATGDVGAGGTINNYGVYIANGTYDTDGTSTSTGLYVETISGADNNYTAVFAGGNVGIGDTTPSATLEVGNGTDTLQVSSTGDLTFVDSNDSSSITGPAGGSLNIAAANSQNLALSTTTAGNITLTPAAAAGLVNILTGNLQVGNGTPGVSLDGEDAYIEGTFEVDGASQFDGLLTANSGASLTRTISTGASTTNVAAITLTAPADNSGTNTYNGLNLSATLSAVSSGGTQTANLINIAAISGDADVTLNGLKIGNLTGTGATEYALNIGSGWDSVLRVNGTEVINGSGQIAAAQVNGTLFTLNGDSGTDSVDRGDTLTVIGGTNITTVGATGPQVTINLDDDITLAGNATINGTTGITLGGSGADLIFANSERITNDTNGTITLGRNDAGTVILNAADDDATAALTILSGGATALTLDAGGAASVAVATTNASALTLGRSGITTTNSGALTITETLTANGIANIGDGGDTIALSGTTLSFTANSAGNDISFNLVDNNTDALDIQQNTDNYLNINTTDSSENIAFGNAVTNPSFSFLGTGDIAFAGGAINFDNPTDLDIDDNTASAFTISEGTNNYLGITTTNGSESIFINPSGVGHTYGMTITSDLSNGSRSTDLLTLTQANNASNNSTGNLLQLTNLDSSSNAALLAISQTSSGTGLDISGVFSGTGINLSESYLSSGTGIDINASVITSGKAINIRGSSYGGLSSFTGDMLAITPSRTISTPGSTSINDSGNYLDITRTAVVSVAATFTISGDLATFSSSCTPSGGGSCVDSSHILSLTQNFSGATGAVEHLTNAGTGQGFLMTSSSTGDLMELDASGAGTTANGLLIQQTGAGTITDAIDVSDETITNGINLGSNFILGNGIQLFSSSSTVFTVEDTSGNDLVTIADNGTTGILTVPGATGYLDLGNITHGSTAPQGLRLPQADSLTAITGGTEGYLAWDADDNQVLAFDGTNWSSISGSSTTLQQAYTAGNSIDVTSGEGALDVDAQSANVDFEIGEGSDTGDFRIWDGTDNWLLVDESADTMSIGAAAGNGLTLDAGTGAINIGNSANAKTITIGSGTGATALNLTSGTGAQTFTSSVATTGTTSSAWVFSDTALTSGTGLYLTTSAALTGNLGQIATSGNSYTSGDLLEISTTSTGITSGQLLNVISTSTGTSFTGNIANISWEPGSATINTTGDVLQVGIGTNGTLSSGYILNVLDGTTTVFGVTETGITSALPHSFTAAGDVSIAYDINLTNQTASYIKSAAPLYIQAGETFESNNLTLQTYNSGNIIFTPGKNVGINTTNPITRFFVSDNSTSTASAWIENTANTNSNNPVALVLKLGNDDNGTDNSDRFINFLRGDSTIIGKIRGNTNAVDYNTAGLDFAEYFTIENIGETYPAGTVMCQGNSGLRPCTSSDSSNLIGVVSDRPGFSGGTEGPDKALVGISGQIPVSIASSSAPIQPGDYITLSNQVTGLAMRASQPGFMIGKALESWTPGSGNSQIQIYIANHWADPNQSLAFDADGNLIIAGQLTAQDVKITTATSELDSLKTKLTTHESTLASLSEQVASLSAQLANLEPNTSSNLPLPDSNWIVASDSGKLMTTLAVQVPELSVTGKLSVGLLSFSDTTGDISSLLGTLSLQNGAATLDENGNLTLTGTLAAKEVKTEKVTVLGADTSQTSDSLQSADNKSVGKAIIPAGLTQIAIDTTAVSTASSIFITPESPVSVAATATQSGQFLVKIPEPSLEPIKLNWWVIN